jgi:hypothetical protein
MDMIPFVIYLSHVLVTFYEEIIVEMESESTTSE